MIKALISILILCFLWVAFSWSRPVDYKNRKYYTGRIIVKPIITEYRHADLYDNGMLYTYLFIGGQVQWTPYVIGAGRTAVDAAGLFNYFEILDDQGYVWENDGGPGNPDHTTRIETDTAGNAFNDNGAIWGYYFTFITRSKDSTKLYIGKEDTYNFYKLPAHAPIKPRLLHAPGGVKWAEISMGLNILGRTTTGDVYEWDNGDSNYVKLTLPGPCVSIASSHVDFEIFAIHNYSGGDPTLGNAYWKGGQNSYVGDVTARSSVFPLSSIWNYPNHIKKVSAGDNVIHFIDSLDQLWGTGDNAMGEIGNGQEVVNRWDYIDPYSWTTVKGGLYTLGVCYMVQTNVKAIYHGNTLTFYWVSITKDDSAWVDGRGKSYANSNLHNNQESTRANAQDLVVPTRWQPFINNIGIAADFVFPRVHCGGNKSIATTSTTVGGLDTAASMGPTCCTIASVTWTQTAGPTTILFGTPSAASTTASNLTTGTYKVRKTLIDSNTGVWVDSATITVNLPAGGCNNCWIHHKGFKKVNLSK